MQEHLVACERCPGPVYARMLPLPLLEPLDLIDIQPALLVPPPVRRLFGDPQAPTHLDDGLPLAQGDLGLTPLGHEVFDGVRDARPTALLSTRP